MSEINPIGQPNNAALAKVAARRSAATPEQAAATSPRSGDKVELSTQARLLDQLTRLPEVRTELIEQVKTEIDAGTYETPERLEATLNALLEELSE